MGYNDDIDQQIRKKTLTGDAYPGYMAFLRGEHKGKDLSRESVNVSGSINRTKGGWIGLQLFVMAPTNETAKAILPTIAALLKTFGFTALPDALIEHLGISLTGSEDTEINEVWPDEAGPLHRTGVYTRGR